MEEELNLDNILGAEEIDSLFIDNDDAQTPPEEKEEEGKNNNKNKESEEKETTEILDVDNLFESESVGSEEIKEEQEDTTSKETGTSPKNFYSSIAKALRDEGIFPDLEDEVANGIKTPADLRDLIDKQITSGIEERNKKIDEALSAGVEPTEIKKYENTINYLNSIKEESLTDESEKGETLRKQLIYQDFINRGYSKERAEREVNKSFNSGSDIEDAKEALNSNKEFFEDSYNELIEEAKKADEELKKTRKKQEETLKKSILEDANIFGEVQVDKTTRNKIYENISKPVYKDPNTGEYLTALQKYQKENTVDYIKNVGILYTLTDGFKNIDKLVKGRVRKEVKKGLAELERTFNSTSRTPEGSLNFTSGVDGDYESNLRSWDLNI
jgi:hypothetical protein